MISLSPEVARYIRPDHAISLYEIEGRRRAMLAEAKAATTNDHLTAWRPEARALVDHLAERHEGDQAKIVAFEQAIPNLEHAIARELEARDEVARATHSHALGSLDRKEQLRRRDDVEAAAGVLTVRTAERVGAANAVLGVGMPANSGVDQNLSSQGLVEGLASFCLRRLRQSPHRRSWEQNRGGIERETWSRWLETPDEDIMWIPFHAARAIASAAKERDLHKTFSPAGVAFEDSRRVAIVLPVDEFVAELAHFKTARAAHLRSKLRSAREALERATASAASVAR